ncbi:hypothetical protein MRX96_058307 [Rhipicephalus microplus]
MKGSNRADITPGAAGWPQKPRRVSTGRCVSMGPLWKSYELRVIKQMLCAIRRGRASSSALGEFPAAALYQGAPFPPVCRAATFPTDSVRRDYGGLVWYLF